MAMERSKRPEINKEEVIAKLKDDGDFDNLRLKVIRKLKDNEELRNNLISIIRQSAALNRPGADNMKPRQLSDAIYEEVGSEAMSKISDGVWEIIRCADGMKNEITETVQSVYDKLVEPERKGRCESSNRDIMQADNDVTVKAAAASAVALGGESSDDEPPGFPLPGSRQTNHGTEELELPVHCGGILEKEKEKEQPRHSKDMMESDDADPSVPPGFAADTNGNQPCHDSDEDSDVPPGFG
ncbi:uncharacterized protein LOC126677445 [Mercurialis annua]|uniref:uncharacterized protein LOC126677445 n=1 Tax=Mercurialis annua TaxID=3986 RepID=UPI00215FF893|nr:uncharacterized protein LOC126677445 [Mercurialis annua]